MKVLLLATALTLVASAHSATNCNWGASYWCQSAATAKECQRTQYCKDNVWKDVAKVSAPQGIECDVCQLVVKFIEEELTKNSTEDEVKQALMQFCNSTGPLSSVCADFVNEYFDQLWQLVISGGLDQACTTLGLCTSSSSPSKSQPRPLKAAKKLGLGFSPSCMTCEFVVKEVLNLVDTNTTEAEAKAEVKKVCVYMGGLASECRELIETFFDEIWKAATSKIGDGKVICQAIKLCPSAKKAKKLRQQSMFSLKKIEDGLPCSICKYAVEVMKPFVDGNSTEDEVKSALETACKIIPFGNFSDECTSFVDSYFDVVWVILKSEVDSGDACVMVKLCNSTNSSSLKAKLQSQPTQTVCDVCKLVALYLKTYVDSNATEQEVRAGVEQLCSFLPSPYNKECNDTVAENFDSIWKLVQDEVDNGKICSDLGLCSSSFTLLKKEPVQSDVKGGVCDVCKLVMTYLRTVVDGNTTEEEAKSMVEKLCSSVPGSLSDECNQMVDEFFPLIWKLLQSYVDDDEICQEINLCGNTTEVAVVQAQNLRRAQLSKAEVGGLFCTVCELIMKEVASLVDANSTKQEIIDALDKACTILPSSLNGDCNQFVKKYGSEIIDLILSGTAAKLVCSALGLCVLEPHVPQPEQLVLGADAAECEVCETVLGLAKTLIGSKYAEDEMDKVLEDVCKVVPSGIRNECKTFIEAYGPQLIQLLDKAIDPQTICTEIKLCSKA